MKIKWLAAVMMLILVAVVAPLVAEVAPMAAALEPLVVGWERYFKLEWLSEDRSGSPVLYGKIFNDGGFSARNVRLLAEGLDARGNVVDQTVTWLGLELTPGTTAPFEVSLHQSAASYRVVVFAYDWVQRGKGIH